MAIGLLEKLQAQVFELQVKVERLEGRKVNEKEAPKETSRDVVVEMAKADIEKLKEGGSYYPVKDSRMPRLPWICSAEYIVNKEKRTVVALLKGYATSTLYAKGIAKCDPSDCFNVHIGKAIALRRALRLEIPSEYLKAPQPTEVRVGDIVDWDGIKGEVNKVSNYMASFEYVKGRNAHARLSLIKLIDDSRDGVSTGEEVVNNA
jgi:signal recognition particle subunit SEC65